MQNPPPDPSTWTAVDPATRLSAALEELCAWYRRAEPMMANVFGDGPLVPALAGRLEEWQAFVQACRAALGRGWAAGAVAVSFSWLRWRRSVTPSTPTPGSRSPAKKPR